MAKDIGFKSITAQTKPINGKHSLTLRNGEGKQLFYIAVNPNQELIQSGIVYNNATQNINMNDNAYPNQLYDLLKNGSAVHSRYIQLKKNLLIGNGLSPVDQNNQKLWDWINEKNSAMQDKDDLLERFAFDLALYEGTYMQIIYDNSKSKPKIAELYHSSYSNIRANEPDEIGNISMYSYSRNFGLVYNQRQYRGVRNQAEYEIPSFNPDMANKTIKNIDGTESKIDTGRQIMPIMQYGGTNIYPTVSYNSVIPYISLSYFLGTYELNRAMNGFFPTTMVYVVGIAGEAEQEKYVQNFEDNFVGLNKSKILFLFGESTDNSPKVEKIDSSEQESVMEKLIDICNQQITIAHSGSMPLSGIESKGQQLGGDQNLLFMSRENFMTNMIIPLQKLLLKKINIICNDTLKLGEVTIINTGLHITLPKEKADSSDMTRSERRDMLWGLPPLPEDVKPVDSTGTGIPDTTVGVGSDSNTIVAPSPQPVNNSDSNNIKL